ncbi:hypothetical protein [Methylocella sp.]|uniref:hypothetical protein n=1 Tax=Methylocella sp. TaxID=1978226 RepID=UPI003782EED1
MNSTTGQAIILANLSALRATLAEALERATEAENVIKAGEQNQAIGTALGIDEMLQNAAALYAAALIFHRDGGP